MKYIILVGDGMADDPIAELDNKTPLQAAHTPHMDRIAREGTGGLVRTVPTGMPPGSAVANLSIMGYDPKKYFTGRAPLEAASMGISLTTGQVGLRCNLINEENGILTDYSGGHISTDEASELINLLQQELGSDQCTFHPGISYRHLLVINNIGDSITAFPPHDIMGKKIATHLPKGDAENILCSLMEKSRSILKDAPVNKRRIAAGKKPANMIWLWGAGRALPFPTLKEQFNLTGAVISAVDLIKGIGTLAGLEVLNVPGATGYIDTNFKGKAAYALTALKKSDFVYLHVEAPDEASHSGNLKDKLTAIEKFDAETVGPVLEGLIKFPNYRVLVLPDHRTPLATRTHAPEKIPFACMGSNIDRSEKMQAYSEEEAIMGDFDIEDGSTLFSQFVSKNFYR